MRVAGIRPSRRAGRNNASRNVTACIRGCCRRPCPWPSNCQANVRRVAVVAIAGYFRGRSEKRVFLDSFRPLRRARSASRFARTEDGPPQRTTNTREGAGTAPDLRAGGRPSRSPGRARSLPRAVAHTGIDRDRRWTMMRMIP